MQPTSLLLRRLPRLSPRLPTPRAPSSIPSPPSIAIPRRHISTKHHPPARPIPAPSPPSHGLLALIGATGGGLGALAGIGGAVFIVPGLVRFCGLTQPAAAGSAMTAVVAVSATSAALHAAEERRGGGDQSGAEEEEEEEAPRSGVCWPVAALVAGAAAVTTPFGARLAPTVNPKWLRRGLGMFLLVLAPMMPLRALLMEEGEGGVGQGVSKDEVVKAGEVTDIAKAELLAGGAGIGFAAGMLGIGGGSLMTPYIAVFQPNLPITVRCSLCCIWLRLCRVAPWEARSACGGSLLLTQYR